MTLDAIMLASMAVASLTAAMLAHRRVAHRPAAVALALLATLNLARLPILRAFPAPGEDIPRALWPLVYLDGARVLAEAAIVPGLALAVSVSSERRRVTVAAVAGIWLLASVVLAALYPSPLVRGEGLRRVYLATDVAGLAVSALAFAWWAGRSKRSPGSEHGIAFALVGLDLVILLGPSSPWRVDFYGGSYDVVRLAIVVFFAAFAVAQVIVWRFSTR